MTKVQTPTASAVSPADAELLLNLNGECCEAGHAITKLLQHGPESFDPTCASGETNRAALEREIGDILGCVEMLVERGILSRAGIGTAKLRKTLRYPDWSHGELAVP